MKGPIISPMIFYWINTFNALSIVFLVVGGVLLAGAVVSIICFLYNKYGQIYYHDPDNYAKYARTSWRAFLWCLILGIIILLIGIFIPGRTTSIEMLAARTITYENTEWTVETIKSVIDYFVEAMKGL